MAFVDLKLCPHQNEAISVNFPFEFGESLFLGLNFIE
jgi:hypothetical protein